jgi:hypothetical protein
LTGQETQSGQTEGQIQSGNFEMLQDGMKRALYYGTEIDPKMKIRLFRSISSPLKGSLFDGDQGRFVREGANSFLKSSFG